ncbi:hypothetical protein [Geobacter metallireducens]|uniref:hypothetical protein n=1 Tax=Geobacter metallireducens TaxID=28232 RepID=UPI00164F2A64|nr:hypothetical protein [Geobacter metallireducens]
MPLLADQCIKSGYLQERLSDAAYPLLGVSAAGPSRNKTGFSEKIAINDFSMLANVFAG